MTRSIGWMWKRTRTHRTGRVPLAIAACLSLSLAAPSARAGGPREKRGAERPAATAKKAVKIAAAATVAPAAAAATSDLKDETKTATTPARPAAFNPWAARHAAIHASAAPAESGGGSSAVHDTSPERGEALKSEIAKHTGAVDDTTRRLESARAQVSGLRATVQRAEHELREEELRAETHASAVKLRDQKSATIDKIRTRLDELGSKSGKSKGGGGLISMALDMVFGPGKSDEESQDEEPLDKEQARDSDTKGSGSSRKESRRRERALLENHLDELRRDRDRLERTIDQSRPRFTGDSRETLVGKLAAARGKLADFDRTASALEQSLSEARTRLQAAETQLSEWKVAEQRAQVLKVRGALARAQEAGMSAGAVGKRWGAKVYSVQKASAASAADNRDAVSLIERDGQLLVAVADGSSVGQLTGEWARLIAHGFTGQLNAAEPSMPRVGALPAPGDKEALKSFLAPFHAQWSKLATAAGPIAQRAITLNGGMTTLVGLVVSPGEGGKWKYAASGAGDSNLFVVRGGKLHTAWPLSEAAQFTSSPAALSFLLDKNPASAWVNHSDTLEPGDQVFATSDALAKWVLDAGKDKAPARLAQLAKVSNPETFAALVKKARSSGMVDDDTTMAHFVVPSPGAE